MGRFETTVPYYRRFRQSYPPEFFRRLAQALHLDGTQRLIDVGCGPAMLALGLAPFVRTVAGVDPEPAMLADAREAASRAGVSLKLHQATIEVLPAEAGPFDVAIIGRALHWMDPPATRAALERLLTPGGAVVVCGSFSAEGANPWLAAYHAVRDRLKEPDERIDYRRDAADFFAGSRFALKEKINVRDKAAISIDILAGRLLSMSNTSPAVLGAKAAGLSALLRESLALFARPDGTLDDVIEAQAAIFASSAAALSPDEQMERFAQELKENDWGHQPC
jgi:SAM-dependent methyltransferase